MNNLLDQLIERSGDDILWYSPETCPITVARLLRTISHVSSDSLRGKRVALGTMPVLELVASIAFLDGLASSILLLPQEEDESSRAQRLLQAEIDIVLEGSGLGLAASLTRSTATGSADGQSPFCFSSRGAMEDTIWLLPTSGTTGSPKLIEHSLASLTRSMSCRRLRGNFVWGSLYSFRRFAGLQVFLQAWLARTPLVLQDDGADLLSTIACLATHGCNALSATPSMWRKLAMSPSFDQLDLKQVTLGGEIVDQPVLDMLKKRFPNARLTHIYASTEAGVGFAVQDGLAGFPVSFLDSSPTGVAMRIDEADHLWLLPNRNGKHSLFDSEEWIDTGDLVRISEQRVYFIGRSNGSINVGGNKVMPEEIEAVITELPEIAFTLVRARKSAILGNLVEAAVVLTPGAMFDAAMKRRIADHCRSRLESFKVPAFIVPLDDIGLSASGKVLRTNTL